MQKLRRRVAFMSFREDIKPVVSPGGPDVNRLQALASQHHGKPLMAKKMNAQKINKRI